MPARQQYRTMTMNQCQALGEIMASLRRRPAREAGARTCTPTSTEACTQTSTRTQTRTQARKHGGIQSGKTSPPRVGLGPPSLRPRPAPAPRAPGSASVLALRILVRLVLVVLLLLVRGVLALAWEEQPAGGDVHARAVLPGVPVELVGELRVEIEGLAEDLLTEHRAGNLPPLELELGGVDGLPGRLVLRDVQLIQVHVLQAVLHGGALLGVPAQHLGEEVLRLWPKVVDGLV
mmetsp:Transcript_8366/g.26643  ORF Transcript_8366/g.26643 Transcript_8366/m.26643 type:complete len:234 (+) Transcript_8366:159-860(+)